MCIPQLPLSLQTWKRCFSCLQIINTYNVTNCAALSEPSRYIIHFMLYHVLLRRILSQSADLRPVIIIGNYALHPMLILESRYRLLSLFFYSNPGNQSTNELQYSLICISGLSKIGRKHHLISLYSTCPHPSIVHPEISLIHPPCCSLFGMKFRE